MTERIQASSALPEAQQALRSLHETVEKAAVNAGIEPTLIELVKIRASQLNGCAFCTDMHARDARKIGEDERRIYLLPAWRETNLYTEQERAALALTDALTTLSAHQDVDDAVYAEATSVFSEEQYGVVAWAVTTINAFNRISVLGRKPLPAGRT